MQVRSKSAVDDLGLTFKDIAARVGRSAGAVGAALTDKPARETPTLKDIFNEFCASTQDRTTLESHARQLAVCAPQTAELLAALLTDLAGLLQKPRSG